MGVVKLAMVHFVRVGYSHNRFIYGLGSLDTGNNSTKPKKKEKKDQIYLIHLLFHSFVLCRRIEIAYSEQSDRRSVGRSWLSTVQRGRRARSDRLAILGRSGIYTPSNNSYTFSKVYFVDAIFRFD